MVLSLEYFCAYLQIQYRHVVLLLETKNQAFFYQNLNFVNYKKLFCCFVYILCGDIVLKLCVRLQECVFLSTIKRERILTQTMYETKQYIFKTETSTII